MKRIIEIDEALYNTIKRTPYSPTLGWREIAQSTPYNPSGDAISRSVVRGLISDKSIPIKFEEEKRGEWRCSSGVLLSDIYKVIDRQ